MRHANGPSQQEPRWLRQSTTSTVGAWDESSIHSDTIGKSVSLCRRAVEREAASLASASGDRQAEPPGGTAWRSACPTERRSRHGTLYKQEDLQWQRKRLSQLQAQPVHRAAAWSARFWLIPVVVSRHAR